MVAEFKNVRVNEFKNIVKFNNSNNDNGNGQQCC